MIRNGQRARGEPKSGPANKVNRGTSLRRRTPRWSLRRALNTADRVIGETTGIVVIKPRNRGGRPPRDPAARALLKAGRAALAQVRLSIALSYGTSPEDLERLVRTSSVVADLLRRPWVIEKLIALAVQREAKSFIP